MRINFQCIAENKPYVYCCGILFTLLSLLTLVNDKVTIFLLLNTVHLSWVDTVMLLLTNAGSGIFSLVVFGIAWVTKRWRLAWNILASFVLSGLLVQILKPMYRAPRPKAVISQDSYGLFFEGITHSGLNSFPSGHATTIFALATLLAFSCKNKYFSLVYFFFACIVGYSRVYLGHHFMEDVLAGSILGTSTAVTFLVLLNINYKMPVKSLFPTRKIFDQWISNLR